MIFVTVGNPTQGFRRLLDAVDVMAGDEVFDGEPVFIQSGNNPEFQPRYCEQKPFLSMDEFKDSIAKAGLVICHAGAGTLIHILQAGKVPVVMPRRKKYGEHVDDHQWELVKALAEQGRVIAAFEPEDLRKAIDKALQQTAVVSSAQPAPMLNIVRKAIQELTGGI